MSQDEPDRLSRIVTMWTLVNQAHGEPASTHARRAQHALMTRYCASVHRYLLGALRDEQAADDLFQEFAVRFLRGDFRRAEAGRGRFRDYVRTVLVNLVNDHHRARQQAARSLPADAAAPQAPGGGAGDDDTTFEDSWRTELMDHAWKSMQHSQPTYYAVLLFHVNNPHVESSAAAAELSASLGKPMTPVNVRVTLHRARERFAELLLQEVIRSLGGATASGAAVDQHELWRELEELNLSGVCEAAFQKWSAKASKLRPQQS